MMVRSLSTMLPVAIAAFLAAFGPAAAQQATTPGAQYQTGPYQYSPAELRCVKAKYPDCPSGCLRNDAAKACVAPLPGNPVGQIGNTNPCEGYYPDCPQFCGKNDALKQCEPLDSYFARKPRTPKVD